MVRTDTHQANNKLMDTASNTNTNKNQNQSINQSKAKKGSQTERPLDKPIEIQTQEINKQTDERANTQTKQKDKK